MEQMSLAEKIKEAVRKAKEGIIPPQETRNPDKIEIVTLEGELKSVGDVMRENPKNKPLDEFGREVFDPTPIAPPVGYVRNESLFEQVRNMVRGEALRAYADSMEAETFEEADDFDVDDDFDPRTPYEMTFEGTVAQDWERRKAEFTPSSKAQGNNLPPDQGGAGTGAAQPRKSKPAKPAEPAADDSDAE